MIEYTGNKVTPWLTERMRILRIIEYIRLTFRVPQTEVNMATATNSLWIWFRSKTCQQAMLQCRASYSIAQLDLIIGSAQRRCMANRYFLLTWAILVNCLFHD